DADEQLEVAIAQIRAEEVLVTLGVGQAARLASGRRPEPLLVLLAARREMQEAAPLHVGRPGELDERAVLAARIGLFDDLELARACQRVLVVALHGRRLDAVIPGGEAVLLLRSVDDLAPRERAGRRLAHERESRRHHPGMPRAHVPPPRRRGRRRVRAGPAAGL